MGAGLAVLGTERLQATIVVEPSGNISRAEAEATFQKAENYLRQVPLARRMINHLERSPQTYTVEIAHNRNPGASSAVSEFDGAHNKVVWDPHEGLEWKATAFTRESHSAAIGLIHELGHAYHKDVNPRAFWRREKKPTHDQWGNAEEKLTILDVENPVAKVLGEPQRSFHEDTGLYEARHYEVVGPTTTRRAPVRRPLFEALF